MSRSVSATALQALYDSSTDQVFLTVLSLSHPSMGGPINVVNNTVSIVSNGTTYLPFPFSIELPDDTDQVINYAKLTIDNVDRTIIAALRTIDGSPTIGLSIILAATPDIVQIGPLTFSLKNVVYDKQTITGKLVAKDNLEYAFPQYNFLPKWFKGLQ